ncbi:exosortase Q [Ottowia sp.]|uniref:exosortase Q n=1 Tax=Ottowia sp. TaxID=1898956 RepID=UPI003A888FBE
MRSALLLHHTTARASALRIDRAPAHLWLGLQTLALWPTWWWMARRWQDGSDDPVGLLALAALGMLLWSVRGQWRYAPRWPWLAAALAGTLAATAWRGSGSPLLTSLLAMGAWACGLLAFLPDAQRCAMRAQDGVLLPAPRRTIAALPVLGLALLALPLIASLQFYAGYPLRVLTAEASRWLLGAWFAVQREGSSLWVNGQLIVVDAPCSGVQMAWAGYFSACAVALWAGRSGRAFALRLPLVSAAVLMGNVLRNSVLVALAASGDEASSALHQAVGLVALGAVVSAIGWAMARAESRPLAQKGHPA